MPSDAGLRKRKKGNNSAKVKSEAEEQDALVGLLNGGTGKTGFFLYIALVLGTAGFVLWQNPSWSNQLLSFFGSSTPSGTPTSAPTGSTPYVVDFTADVPKRQAVVDAFKHAWLAYERDAMGADEYHPISHKGSNLSDAGGIGYTIVDSIDTMQIMGLTDEYERARDWVEKKLDFNKDGKFNTFETTIRVLGGLLSAYHFSSDPLFLDKAKDLADRILPAFDTPSGLPVSMINLAQRVGVSDVDNRGLVSTAEASTLQLEFRYLSLLTDDEEYWRKAEKVMQVIKGAHLATGLASIFMNPEDGRFVLAAIRLGSRGDSYYEYLLKQYIQTNMTELVYRDMYDDAMNGVHQHLIQKSYKAGLIYISELIPEHNRMGSDITWRLSPKQDHLVCFFGGSLMLGATVTGAINPPVSIPPQQHEFTEQGWRDWNTGKGLTETCVKTHDTATGLSPEIVHFRIPRDGLDGTVAPDDWYIKGARRGEPPPYDARYILRPETVESLFIAFRLTGDPRYRAQGWSIFQAIEKHCKVPTGGYASILNVDEVPAEMEDKMETFLMSETLKYLYLLFDDATTLPLSEYVFNTEAHPLPIFNPTIRTGFS
ncbi:glycoside hydrolase [Cristinia sonorae]|uniref:alpha-1,2-Mannosidase n=1 Tax=Cristinia sonorae TaxID=1940300 RepID=A0A8K0UJK2_9AGAR|nr:glycoside hydrolase [Cristinia sonorae]